MYIIDNTDDLKRYIYLLELQQIHQWAEFKNASQEIIKNNQHKIQLLKSLSSWGLGYFSNVFNAHTPIKSAASCLLGRNLSKFIGLAQLAVTYLQDLNKKKLSRSKN